jgi:hypothetical protein
MGSGWLEARGWRVWGIAILAVTGLACEGEGGGSGSGMKSACGMEESLPPSWLAGPTAKGSIEAYVRAACDPAPQYHRLTMWLEREGSDGKSFYQVGESLPHVDIPPVFGKRYRVVVQCVDGNWRVRAKAEGTGPTGVAFTETLRPGDVHVRIIRCGVR